MFKKFKTSYELVKVSFMYIKRDWELLVYSLFSLIASLIILATFIWVDIFFVWGFDQIWKESSEWNMIVYIYTFLYYFVFSFISFFFNTAIICSVNRRNNWEDNKIWDWLRDSMKHIKQIFIWSLISASVSFLLKMLQNKFWENSIIWKIIVWIVWWMWNILTFFSFPLMILNNVWPREAINKSWELFKKTWWERAIIHVWVWLFFFLLFFLTFLLGMFIVFVINPIFWIIFIVLSMLFLWILWWTTDVIIKTILLYYAEHNKLPTGLEWNELIISIASEK